MPTNSVLITWNNIFRSILTPLSILHINPDLVVLKTLYVNLRAN